MVRKITAGVLAVMMIFGTGVLHNTVNVLPETVITASADENVMTYGDYEYKVLDVGTVEIEKYKGSDDKVTIPSEIDGKKVTKIGAVAFFESESSSVIVPDGVTNIGPSAFAESKLSSITLPASLKTIENKAFYSCSKLKAIEIPDGVTSIGNLAFYYTGIESVVIPDSVKTLEKGAFEGCLSLKSVKIGSGVTNISYGAFLGCAELTDLTIGNGVKIIETSAFYGCTNLAEVTIPASVTNIELIAFARCDAMKSVTIPSTVKKISGKAFGYYKEEHFADFLKTDGFKIYCYKDTAGEKYAIENEFDYELLGSAHTLGDLNGDNKIDISDVTMLINHINGVKALTADQLKLADVNGDGIVDVGDAAAIINHINGVKNIY